MNHPVIQQYWRWCQNSISASCGYELLIISNEILHIPITLWGSSSFDNKETRTFLASIFFLRLQNFAKLPLPWQACLVWRVKTICCSQLPRHYKGSHAYSKVWRTNKTITFSFRAPSTFIVMSNFHRFKVLHKWWRWLRDSYLPNMPT